MHHTRNVHKTEDKRAEQGEHRLFKQAKKKQAEQMLFNYEMLRKGNKEYYFKIKIRSLYFFKIYSSKYKVIGKKKSNFSPYRLICFNSLECFLYNNNLIFIVQPNCYWSIIY